jgi:hypothetical protein
MRDIAGDYFWVVARDSERDWPKRDLATKDYQVGEGLRMD